MDRVEGAKHHWVQPPGRLEDGRRHLGQRQTVEHLTHPGDPIGRHPPHGAHEFGANQIAGDGLARLLGEPSSERLGLGLLDHELGERGRVEVVGHGQ